MTLPKKVLDGMKGYPEFYQKVWRATAEIPKGETRTYGWIAKKIGKPGAARAVGQALGKNPFAPTVPCHRVVGANSLGGFSSKGGLADKVALLKREGVDIARRKAVS